MLSLVDTPRLSRHVIGCRFSFLCLAKQAVKTVLEWVMSRPQTVVNNHRFLPHATQEPRLCIMRDEDLWHERILLGHSTSMQAVGRTPDSDVCVCECWIKRRLACNEFLKAVFFKSNVERGCIASEREGSTS